MVWLMEMSAWPANCGLNAFQIAQTFTSVIQHLRDHGTVQPQTHVHDSGRILQAEEQILERIEEESDISTGRLAAEVGVSQLVVHRRLKEQGHIHTMCKKCKVWSPFIVHVV